MGAITYIGGFILEAIRYVGSISMLLGQTIYFAFVPPFKFHRILSQANRFGPGSLLIGILIAFFVGMILALQMAYLMVRMSAEIYIPNVLSVSLTRELAPVLIALVVAGRVGAGMTAEIGTMKVTEQVDALRAFAVNPVKYLVVPRFIALVVTLPLLTVIADIVGILGGYVICVYKLGVTSSMYFMMIIKALDPPDIIGGLIKTFFFGAVIALVGCYQGLNVQGGAEGVGKATTMSVVISFILIILTDCLFTTLIYFVFKM